MYTGPHSHILIHPFRHTSTLKNTKAHSHPQTYLHVLTSTPHRHTDSKSTYTYITLWTHWVHTLRHTHTYLQIDSYILTNLHNDTYIQVHSHTHTDTSTQLPSDVHLCSHIHTQIHSLHTHPQPDRLYVDANVTL